MSFPSPSSRATPSPTRRRPWPEFVSLASLTRPYTFHEATTRIKQNLSYFSLNYVYITLFCVFISLLRHPISLIVFLVIFAAWFFLYLYRDSELVVFNMVVGDKVLVLLLCGVTIVGLGFTGVWVNVLVSVVVGLLVVLVHAVFRRSEDLYWGDDDGLGDSGLKSFVGYSQTHYFQDQDRDEDQFSLHGNYSLKLPQTRD